MWMSSFVNRLYIQVTVSYQKMQTLLNFVRMRDSLLLDLLHLQYVKWVIKGRNISNFLVFLDYLCTCLSKSINGIEKQEISIFYMFIYVSRPMSFILWGLW